MVCLPGLLCIIKWNWQIYFLGRHKIYCCFSHVSVVAVAAVAAAADALLCFSTVNRPIGRRQLEFLLQFTSCAAHTILLQLLLLLLLRLSCVSYSYAMLLCVYRRHWFNQVTWRRFTIHVNWENFHVTHIPHIVYDNWQRKHSQIDIGVVGDGDAAPNVLWLN